MAMYDSPLNRKHRPTPSEAMRRPPTAGPSRRPLLKTALFRATALDTNSGPTISMVNDWRVGRSRHVTMPSRKART